MPDDERKGRRLGDETKGRIADLASGWTVDSDAPPVPEPPIKRDASGPNRAATDAPRRKAKTQPPPPPGSAARKALEDKIVELRDVLGDSGEDFGDAGEGLGDAAEAAKPPALSAAPRPPPPVPARGPRAPSTATGQAPAVGKAPASGKEPTPAPPGKEAALAKGKGRAARSPEPLDLATLPEADRTQENRGAVGVKYDRSASLTTNSASGTIGGDTPSPIFDRAAIAAGQRGALASDRLADPPRGAAVPEHARDDISAAIARLGSPPGDGVPRGRDRGSSGPAAGTSPSPSGTGPAAAIRGTPRSGALVDRAAPSPPPTALAGPPATPADARRHVPVGEFDEALTLIEQDKLRSTRAQSTIKRDLGFDEPTRKRGDVGFDDPTRSDNASFHDSSGSSTGRFDRDDATGTGGDDDATAIAGPPGGHVAATGTLRSPAVLPRRRGIAGDLRYIATVIVGLRRARRELAALTARQVTRQQSRRHHLVTLGRAAVTVDGFEHAALRPARERLASVEDERSQHAGHVVAADAELARVGRDRDAAAKQYAVDIAALDAELAGLVKKLEPLDREVLKVKKRAADLHEALRRIDATIAATDASLDGPRSAKLDRAEVQAEIASLRADRKAIQSDEPALAGQLDALNPRVAALEAARVEAQRKRAELDTAEHDDQRRAEELLAAIGAKRKVVDRAAADAEALRDKLLFQLGERLYADRPEGLTPELAPVDSIDLEIGSADHRAMELREILASVDRWKLVRGVALLVVLLAALGALTGAIIYLRA